MSDYPIADEYYEGRHLCDFLARSRSAVRFAKPNGSDIDFEPALGSLPKLLQTGLAFPGFRDVEGITLSVRAEICGSGRKARETMNYLRGRTLGTAFGEPVRVEVSPSAGIGIGGFGNEATALLTAAVSFSFKPEPVSVLDALDLFFMQADDPSGAPGTVEFQRLWKSDPEDPNENVRITRVRPNYLGDCETACGMFEVPYDRAMEMLKTCRRGVFDCLVGYGYAPFQRID